MNRPFISPTALEKERIMTMETTKHLLPPVKEYFKAGLHSHSTFSDGKITPEESKAEYKRQGYKILCITDHNINVAHPELNEPDFLMLTGFELNTRIPEGWRVIADKVYHLLFIAKRPDNLWQPIPRWGVTEHDPVAAPQAENLCRDYDIDAVNALIARGNEKGFLCCYNHPVWSLQSYPDYAPLKGLWAMEMCNYGSVRIGYDGNDGRIYHEMVRLGMDIVPLGTDDAHSIRAIGGAWTMIGAEELTYESVIQAMEQGDLYMSTGPEIHSLTLCGNLLRVTCSPAASVNVETSGRWAKIKTAQEKGQTITDAEFDLSKFLEGLREEPEAFIRLTVTAPDGTYAATRAYRIRELTQ